MNEVKKCEKCGANTELRVEGSTEGFFCLQCGWSLVTTCIPQIAQDITKYKMYLLTADSRNKKQIRALSKVANINFLQAKKMIQKQRSLIIQDEALTIDNARSIFDEVGIEYAIEPDFLYEHKMKPKKYLSHCK